MYNFNLNSQTTQIAMPLAAKSANKGYWVCSENDSFSIEHTLPKMASSYKESGDT